MAYHPNIEIVSTVRCELDEGPVWDVGNSKICWVDILRNSSTMFHGGMKLLARVLHWEQKTAM